MIMKKARVFISGGQANKDEKEWGIIISDWFRDRGFDPYFAEQYSTPEGLTENIFNILKESEYFVCINFERENSKVGSLFVQQELAIAAFLKIPMVGFHKGEIELHGIEKYILLNANKVETPEEIIKVLEGKTKEWNPNSVNQLFLSFGNHQFAVPSVTPDRRCILDQDKKCILGDYYHITIHNKSRMIHTLNCIGYIESIKSLDNNEYIFKDDDYKTELIWAGTGDIKINIPTNGKRDLDAFIYFSNTKKIHFHQRTTSSYYGNKELDKGSYEIIYVIISDNMPITKLKIEFNFKDKIEILGTVQI
jgi:hypothetical protein